MAPVAGYSLAVGGHLVGELALVDILMAIRAMPGRVLERHFGFRPRMAGQAGGSGMASLQDITGGTVVEGDSLPGILVMA